MKYSTSLDDVTFTIDINQEGIINVNGVSFEFDFVQIGDSNLYSLLINNESFEALVEQREGKWYVLLRGHLYTIDVADERAQRMTARTGAQPEPSGETAISAPMPGLVVAVQVEEGQEVESGQSIVILESMKMENELKAPRSGVVERVAVRAGDSVDQHAVLVVIA